MACTPSIDNSSAPPPPIYFTPTPSFTGKATPTPTSRQLPNDAQIVPDTIRQLESQRNSITSIGFEPAWSQTSDFMVGEVAISIILPACSGSNCTQNGWTTSSKAHVLSEVQDGLDWWKQQALSENVIVDFIMTNNTPLEVSTTFEPIEIPGGGPVLCGNEGLWIDDVMANLGYDDYSGGETHLMEVREYNNDLRSQHNSDWALTIFVADSSNNPDGMFGTTDCGGQAPPFEVAAYAYIGGPFFVMNTITNGYGNNFLDGVTAHELGHVFGAPDEVPSNTCKFTGTPTCNSPYGYLGGENQNCNPCLYGGCTNPCAVDIPLSMMRSPEDCMNGTCTGEIQNVIHQYTVQQVGWEDVNNNGIADTIDTNPDVALSSAPASTTEINPIFSGSTQDTPYPSALPFPEPSHLRPAYPDETINNISSVQFRVNGGAWANALPQDGQYDSAMEDFQFQPLFCENGAYNIEVQAINSVGNVSTIQSHTINVNLSSSCENIFLPAMRNGNTSQSSLLVPPSSGSSFGDPYPPPSSSSSSNLNPYP